MFGYSLSHDEERAVLELLGVVATADREVSRAEKQYVVNLSHDFNASAEGVFSIVEEKSLEEICEDFDEQTARKLALVYAIQLSFVDGLFNQEEWLGVRHIGDVLGVPDAEVADLEDWVRRGLEWEEEGRQLLGLEPYWSV